jgi:MerR family transcriptional regulator, redox-sensitive transcriptional activator SoxR
VITSRRTNGNQRRFARDALCRVAFIRAAQRVGIPLTRVKEAFALLPEERTPTREDWKKVSLSWKDDLTSRIEQLQRLRDNLTECIGCGCLSVDRCALANPCDTLGDDGPGARRLMTP